MSCIYPLLLKHPRTKYPIQVPCGQCMNCRLSKSMQLSFLSNLELQKQYRLNKSSSFVTLTYSDASIPFVRSDCKLIPTIRKSDLQDFFKRFRYHLNGLGYTDNDFKVVSCAEYGDKFNRPHFHFCLLGINSTLADYVTAESWQHKGLIDSGVLFAGGINYVSKYMTKSPTGKLADVLYTSKGLEKPFLTHSIGIGDKWLSEHLLELQENNYCYYNAGQRVPLPPYIRRKLDSAKLFDVVRQRQDLQEIAQRNGFKDSLEFQKVKSFNCEKMLIDYSRQKGVPVPNMSVFHHENIYNIDDVLSRSVSPLIKSFASEALDNE